MNALGGRRMCAGASGPLAKGVDSDSETGESGSSEAEDLPASFLLDALEGIGVAREADAGVAFLLRLATGWPASHPA